MHVIILLNSSKPLFHSIIYLLVLLAFLNGEKIQRDLKKKRIFFLNLIASLSKHVPGNFSTVWKSPGHNHYFIWWQMFCKDDKIFSLFSNCLNATLPWRNFFVKTLVH